MSKDKKANGIKLIYCNDFRCTPEEIEFERMPTVADKIVGGCLWLFAGILLFLTVFVAAAIYYA